MSTFCTAYDQNFFLSYFLFSLVFYPQSCIPVHILIPDTVINLTTKWAIWKNPLFSHWKPHSLITLIHWTTYHKKKKHKDLQHQWTQVGLRSLLNVIHGLLPDNTTSMQKTAPGLPFCLEMSQPLFRTYDFSQPGNKW